MGMTTARKRFRNAWIRIFAEILVVGYLFFTIVPLKAPFQLNFIVFGVYLGVKVIYLTIATLGYISLIQAGKRAQNG